MTVRSSQRFYSTVRDLLRTPTLIGSTVTVHGWVRTARRQKRHSFLELSDGSCASGLQVVWPEAGGGAPGGALAPADAARQPPKCEVV